MSITGCGTVYGNDSTAKNESHIDLDAELRSQSYHLGSTTRKPHQSTDHGHCRALGVYLLLSVDASMCSAVNVRSARRCQQVCLVPSGRRLLVVCDVVCSTTLPLDDDVMVSETEKKMGTCGLMSSYQTVNTEPQTRTVGECLTKRPTQALNEIDNNPRAPQPRGTHLELSAAYKSCVDECRVRTRD